MYLVSVGRGACSRRKAINKLKKHVILRSETTKNLCQLITLSNTDRRGRRPLRKLFDKLSFWFYFIIATLFRPSVECYAFASSITRLPAQTALIRHPPDARAPSSGEPNSAFCFLHSTITSNLIF